jgi:hypothetical protein
MSHRGYQPKGFILRKPLFDVEQLPPLQRVLSRLSLPTFDPRWISADFLKKALRSGKQ